MSAHMKAHLTKSVDFVDVKIEIPGGRERSYHIPTSAIGKLDSFLKKLEPCKSEITPWNESKPWNVLAKERLEKYKKSGLVLRGARLRENMSQVELAKKSKVHQNEISKIENGKRTVGEKVAKRLAKALNFDYQLLLDLD